VYGEESETHRPRKDENRLCDSREPGAVPDCDYCGAAFDDETTYLDHLASEHDGELSAIDRRRVDERGGDDDGGVSPTVLVGALAVAGIVVVVGAILVFGGSGPDRTTDGNVTAEGNTVVDIDGEAPDGLETEPLPDRGREDVIGVVAEESSRGRDHVSPSQLDYDPSNPPTSGPHDGGGVQEAGFYTAEDLPSSPQVLFGDVVHSLEHGAVVVYYDPEAVTPEARESLQAFADRHTDPFASVVVLPHPGEPTAAYELTAWKHRLYLEGYDARVVRAFVAEYLGRGPERPQR